MTGRSITMSQQKEEVSDKGQGKVQVNDLPQREKELTDSEAKDVKGGYGPYRSTGEEIPQ